MTSALFKRAGYILIILFATVATGHAWSGKVVGVADGDTISVLRKNKQIKIRLNGIDAPEKGQPCGNKAKKFINSKIRKKSVEIVPITQDKYGRRVAMVYHDGKNINESLLKAGYAWVYHKYCKEEYCNDWLEVEKRARERKLGLWADKNPIPPWLWRNGEKNASNKPVSIPGPYHGNTNSRVFHQESCKHYNCKNCTKGFNNKIEAIMARYKPCGMCRP